MKVILVHPAHDQGSQRLSNWLASVLSNLDVTANLTGVGASEENLRKSLSNAPEAGLICFYGHGEVDYLLGYDSAGNPPPLIHVRAPGVEPSELSNRNLYAVACYAGVQLGPALGGARCNFVGYRDKFQYVIERQDDFAKVVNVGLVEWASKPGKTAGEITDLLKAEWAALRKAAIREALNHVPNAFLVAHTAHSNYNCLCSYP
jgi:hypothetical protein